MKRISSSLFILLLTAAIASAGPIGGGGSSGGGGGSGTVSGQTTGQIPLATGTTTVGSSSGIAATKGLANNLTVTGGTTGNPVALSATGSDTNIVTRILGKGPLGFTSLGQATYGPTYETSLEIYNPSIGGAGAGTAYGVYNENIASDVAGVVLSSFTNTTSTPVGGVTNADTLFGTSNIVSHYSTGNLDAGYAGFYGAIARAGSGNTNYLAGIYIPYAAINLGSSPVTKGYGLWVVGNDNTGAITTWYGVSIEPPIAGAIGTNYGLKIEDVSTGTTKYAIHTGAGTVHLGDLTASRMVATDASKNLVSAPAGVTATCTVMPTQMTIVNGLITSITGGTCS